MQKTEYVFPSSPPPSLKSTRIQASFVHTCIDQPGSGVAETSFAELLPSSNTTRPPSVRYPFTSPEFAAAVDGAGGFGGALDGVREGRAVDGEGLGLLLRAEGDGEREGDGEVRYVDETSGSSVDWPIRCGAPPPTEIGTARGGSYAVPVMTVCTPHHDSVTAAPVASDHASACTSPRCIGHILHHAHLDCPLRYLPFRLRPLLFRPLRRFPAAAGPGPRPWRTVPPMASVLVVEDDQFVRSALIRHLSEASHTVRSVGTALEALREVAHFRFDVVILDLGLPDLDGAEALKMLRSITDVPVIIATARDDESEIVRLLNDGADDYLTKPFSVEHLSARMAAVLRRSRAAGDQAPPPRVIRVGGLAIDPLRRRAELDGTELDLTRREFDLLTFLAGRPGVVVARKELLAEVWQQSYGDDQTIDVHLSWLRRKLGETAARPRYLHTLRGVGVKLQPPADAPAVEPPA